MSERRKAATAQWIAAAEAREGHANQLDVNKTFSLSHSAVIYALPTDSLGVAITVCVFAEEDQQHKLIVQRRTHDIPLQVVNSIRNASICGLPASASSWHASAFSAICIFKLLPGERQERRAGRRPSRRNQRAWPRRRHATADGFIPFALH